MISLEDVNNGQAIRTIEPEYEEGKFDKNGNV